MTCRHNYQYSQGSFHCSKCGKRSEERTYKKNHRKSYAGIILVGVSILVGIYVYSNYDITYEGQGIGDILPIDEFENSMNEISNVVSVDEIENVLNDFSDNSPVKIEPKLAVVEIKLTPVEIKLLRDDWMKNKFNEKYTKLEMDCPDHPLKIGHIVIGGDDEINDAIFERCILQ